MSIYVVCDRCGLEIDGDFTRVNTDFFTTDTSKLDEAIAFCAYGDQITLCKHCSDAFDRFVGDKDYEKPFGGAR